MSQEELIEQLRAEIVQLRELKAQEAAEKTQALAENRQLRELVEELSRRLQEKTQEAVEREELRAENQHLRESLEELHGQVQKLSAQVSKDSSNSSKPPSTDGYAKKTRSGTHKRAGRNQEDKKATQALRGAW